jgi:SAM-dependent methyltransferase
MTSQLLHNNTLDLATLNKYCAKPPFFEPGEPHFWDDPHIATQMLEAHLDPTNDAASFRPEIREKIVRWIPHQADLKPGDSLLDLGCGPGLYCKAFAELGLKVTGMDMSENSLNYAREHDSKSTYIHQNYLTLDLENQFDVVTLISRDFCVLSPEKASRFLQNVHRALKPSGCFIFDVTSKVYHDKISRQPRYYIAREGGFWKSTPHLTLMQAYDYLDHDTMVEQFVVIEDNGTVTVYRNWFHYYSAETITPLLEEHGFLVEGVYSDLTGSPYSDDAEFPGFVAQKVG